MGIGDWGLGIGDWGLGIGPNPQSPIQSPIPNPQFYDVIKSLNYSLKLKENKNIYIIWKRIKKKTKKNILAQI